MKMAFMDKFTDRFKAYCASKGTSPHKVAQETGVSTTMVSDWMNAKREPKPNTAMEALKKFANYQALEVDYPTLAYWWSMDHMPKEAFEVGFKELYEKDSSLKEEVEKAKAVKSQPKPKIESILPSKKFQ